MYRVIVPERPSIFSCADRDCKRDGVKGFVTIFFLEVSKKRTSLLMPHASVACWSSLLDVSLHECSLLHYYGSIPNASIRPVMMVIFFSNIQMCIFRGAEKKLVAIHDDAHHILPPHVSVLFSCRVLVACLPARLLAICVCL